VELHAGAHVPLGDGLGLGLGLGLGDGLGEGDGDGDGEGVPLTGCHNAGTFGGSQPTCEVCA